MYCVKIDLALTTMNELLQMPLCFVFAKICHFPKNTMLVAYTITSLLLGKYMQGKSLENDKNAI